MSITFSSLSENVLSPKYRCTECGDIHDDQEDAVECCPTEIQEVYQCPICKKNTYAEESDAIECCGFDPDLHEIRPSAAELEAHGQMRLEAFK